MFNIIPYFIMFVQNRVPVNARLPKIIEWIRQKNTNKILDIQAKLVQLDQQILQIMTKHDYNYECSQLDQLLRHNPTWSKGPH